MALQISEFDTVRELLNHRADTEYHTGIAKKVDAMDAVQRAYARIQERFPDVALSPYMNSAIRHMPAATPSDPERAYGYDQRAA